VPYRLDVCHARHDALDRLVELGAIDVEFSNDGAIAALMPDSVGPEQVAHTLGTDEISVSSAEGRDAGSVWLLSPRPIRIGAFGSFPRTPKRKPTRSG
jgi:hypothetical protein